MIVEVPVRVSGYNPVPTRAVVRVDQVDRTRRVRRAVSGFAMFMGLAVVSIFIPAAHFVLVPLFFLGAFVIFFARVGVSAIATGARGTCPDCGLEQDFDVQGTWHAPVDLACKGCRRRLTLSVEVPGA